MNLLRFINEFYFINEDKDNNKLIEDCLKDMEKNSPNSSQGLKDKIKRFNNLKDVEIYTDKKYKK